MSCGHPSPVVVDLCAWFPQADTLIVENDWFINHNSFASPSFSMTPQIDGVQAQLKIIEQLLDSDPARADAMAAKLLADSPEQPMALLFQGIARRLLRKPAAAIEVLEPLCQRWPAAPLPHLQLGLALREMGRMESAVEAIRRSLTAKPDFPDAWLELADLLWSMADRNAADQAFQAYIAHSAHDQELLEVGRLLRANRTNEADSILRARLARHPTDVIALCWLADVAMRERRISEAEALLERCLELAPSYRAARHNYAVTLLRQNRPAQAMQEVDRLLLEAPRNAELRTLRAAILMSIHEYEQAIGIYRDLLQEQPLRSGLWSSLGHALRMIGEQESCIAAYRTACKQEPWRGEAYWNLANLKTVRITDAELETMYKQLENPALGEPDRIHFHFAIGKATEDRGMFAESFRHYAEGNRLHRRSIRYEPADFSDYVRRSKALFSSEFFAQRANQGAIYRDPIFIVGLPRTGSTLVEQILASHSAVEGTAELSCIATLVRSIEARNSNGGIAYPEALANLTPQDCRQLADAYYEQARVYRKRDTPLFTDKMPNNFAHIGLIHLIMPNARIIDVRRHPLACGLSLFKHLFTQGQPFSYSLEDIGQYYRDYIDLMSHFDAVLPGRVHRVIYERLISDTETEVRRLLDYCGLPFERACLKFHENKRAVSTASSEQVRTPVFRDALEHWRNYEPWLEPLKTKLVDLVDSYPTVP